MQNFTVQKKQMLTPKSLSPSNKWSRLNTNLWIWDKGLIDKLDAATGHGKYFITEKGHKCLWDLLTYCGDQDMRIIMEHYGYPGNLREFILWVYNNVCVADEWKKGKHDNQMDCFPYQMLYMHWSSNVLNREEEAA